MKKILITGATGFIGKNLAEHFLSKTEYEVHAVSSKQLDLLDEAAVRNYLRQHMFDVIIHAANTRPNDASLTPYSILDRNLRMFFHLEQCRDVYGKMYYFGSGAEYDMRHYVPAMKESWLGAHIPADPYGFAKYSMARIAEKSEKIYDLTLFGVFGKYELWQRRFISNAICRALKGLPITLQKNMYFDYLWIDDLCRIMDWFIETTPQHHRYNVCRGEVISLLELARSVRDITEIDSDILVAEEGMKPEYSGENSRLLKEMGEFSFTPFESAIGELVAFYREHIDELDERALL